MHGHMMTAGRITIAAGSHFAEHAHPQEQITMILSGRLDMNIGGAAYTLTEGMVHVIPPHTLHSAYAVSDCVVIDVFHPVREDYR